MKYRIGGARARALLGIVLVAGTGLAGTGLATFALPGKAAAAGLQSSHVAGWGKAVKVPASAQHPEADIPAPHRGPGISAAGGRNADSESFNWSGEIEQGSGLTSVSAYWTVPSVSSDQLNAFSATWIGIDGTATSDLIQAGTAQNVGLAGECGTSDYYAWYELLPANEMCLGAVSPGDEMYASISQVNADTWTVDIQDVTQNVGASGPLQYVAHGNSAEFIQEAPSDDYGNVLPLADFGRVTFSDMKVDGAAPSICNLDPTILVSQQTDQIEAYPSNYSSHSGTFTDYYGTTSSTPPTPEQCSASLPSGSVVGMANSHDGYGYWIVDNKGQVAPFGDAADLGQVTGTLSAPVVAVASTSDGGGFWLVTSAGQVISFGDAKNYGGLTAYHLNKPIISMAGDPKTGGYWLLGADGGVFSFNAPFYGSTGGVRLNKPAVGMVGTANGGGYYFVASDGGVFTFGNAPFYGSTGGVHLHEPVVGMALDPATGGYWMDAADGGIFSFAAPFYGSTGGVRLAKPCVSMTSMPAGSGYTFVASDGGIFTFGQAPFEGSAA